MVDGSEHIKFLVLAFKLLDHNVLVPLSCTSKMNTQCIVIKTPHQQNVKIDSGFLLVFTSFQVS